MSIRHLLIISFALITGTAPGQKFDFMQPVRLGDQINSAVEELCPLLSQDGKTLYFARALDPANVGGELGGIDIWISTKDQSGEWQLASNRGNNWNNKYNNAVVGLNQNGSVVYLLNAYERGNGIAFSKVLNGIWSTPERILVPGVTQSNLGGCYMNSTFDVLLLSMKGQKSLGLEDLFVSLKDSLGKWSEPINLGTTINTPEFEISPFLSNDNRMLYFSSNGHPGRGDSDIFVAERLYDSWTIWTKPRNLGEIINSEKFDSSFSIYGDSICLFSSNRNSDFLDIYQSRIMEQKSDTIPAFPDNIKYLSQDEVIELTGKDFQGVLFFAGNLIDLNQAHKNILSELSQSLVTRQEINIRLISLKSDTMEELDHYQRRLLNVLRYLKSMGIEGSRVTFGSETIKTASYGPGNAVVIKLYK